MKEHERMLPGDWQRKSKYDKLDDTEKQIQQQDGFFTFPEDLKGTQDQNEQEFLVFYFRNTEQYEYVRNFFEIVTHSKLSHPKLNSNKLYKLVKKAILIKKSECNED